MDDLLAMMLLGSMLQVGEPDDTIEKLKRRILVTLVMN